MRYLAPIPSQFLDETGTPYYNGKVYVYIHGDSQLALADIYQNAETDELAENPAPLDSHGMWQAFVDADRSFDYLVKDSDGNVVASFYDVTFPTGEGVPEIYVESRDGTINVETSLSEGRQTFNIEVNKDTFKPAYARFTHSTVTGSGTDVELDSFEPDGDGNSDIYLTDGKLTLAKGLYHVSMNMCLGNGSLGNEYLEVIISFGGNELKKVWDRSFIHEESVELGMDISVEEDSSVVLPTINDFPEGMYCSITRLDVHSVGGAGAAGSHSVEHDGTLVGDGTHENPLGVKDYSEIRSDVDAVSESLTRHETANDAHQDIRDELERKEDKDNKVTSWGSTPSNEKYPSEKLVKDTLDNLPPGTAVKGDAESEYRTGNVNLTPANIGAATASQGDKADTAVQGVKVNGTELSKDSNNKVDVPVPTASTATPLKDGTASAGSSSQWARGDHVHPTDDSREAVSNKKQVVNDSSTTEYPSSKAVADFVNSSVATNTANFLGTISESSLGLDYTATNEQIALALNVHSWVSTPTNNDYCFVSVNDPQTTDVDEYRRFKFNGSVWAYEYTLNNSSFTQPQWDAINSGLTSSDRTAYNAAVTLLNAHVNDGSIHVTSSEKNAWNAKQDAISDLATIRSGAAAGATALQPNGNGSNLSITPDGTSTGYDLGSSTTLKAFAQKFKNLVGALKALAFKDKASYNDLSSGVQSSLDKADSALQSHQSVTDNNPTLAWGTTSKVGSVGSTDLRVTMPSNPAQNLPASVITSGTFGTDRIADDAITAAKVKDNETLPVNITGDARALPRFLTLNSGTDNAGSTIVWQEIGRSPFRGASGAPTTIVLCGQGDIGTLPTNWILEFNYRSTTPYGLVYAFGNISTANEIKFGYYIEDNSDKTMHIIVKYPAWIRTVNILCLNKDAGFIFDVKGASTTEPTGIVYVTNKLASVTANYGYTIGSPTTPVYVDSNGQVQPCTQGATLKSNTATLYIKGYTDGNIPYYNVKDIKNGCVNHVDFSGITNSTCNITFEAPSLSTGEEYDYIISLEGYTNNSGYSTGAYVENCKQILHYISDGNVWVGEGLFLQATDWRQICVVRGNTCEWKRVALS